VRDLFSGNDENARGGTPAGIGLDVALDSKRYHCLMRRKMAQ
jgi:hypothetical protein